MLVVKQVKQKICMSAGEYITQSVLRCPRALYLLSCKAMQALSFGELLSATFILYRTCDDTTFTCRSSTDIGMHLTVVSNSPFSNLDEFASVNCENAVALNFMNDLFLNCFSTDPRTFCVWEGITMSP